MLAALRGHVDTTAFLISAAANVHAIDVYQCTALHMAVSDTNEIHF